MSTWGPQFKPTGLQDLILKRVGHIHFNHYWLPKTGFLTSPSPWYHCHSIPHQSRAGGPWKVQQCHRHAAPHRSQAAALCQEHWCLPPRVVTEKMAKSDRQVPKCRLHWGLEAPPSVLGWSALRLGCHSGGGHRAALFRYDLLTYSAVYVLPVPPQEAHTVGVRKKQWIR